MSDVKQVKVDNWGIYFLQRLKHFFNRTDYCDLTLQFQDNAQLKVHRLVLNACTEYFELLERTCEMYEDCLVMPDDLQADVVVPIVNFMYTGHLEFKQELLERLYQTSQILNMPVLSKLLESHRIHLPPKQPTHSYSAAKRYSKQSEPRTTKTSTAATTNKRSYSKAFDNSVVYKDKRSYQTVNKPDTGLNTYGGRAPSPISVDPFASRKTALNDPRPTRYELPEELDTDNVFDNSFCNISYTSQPLMVHPDTVKRYKAKRSNVFGESSGSKKIPTMSTVDIVECKKISSKDDSLFDDSNADHSFNNESDLFNASYLESEKDTNQLFDQILDSSDSSGGPKVTIETKDSKAASNLDHARIISEVLKKYPHLVKSNKNIKLKILDPVPGKSKKQSKSSAPVYVEEKPVKLKKEVEDFTYETDIIDSKQAAKLIAMGAENTKGPWICLICGTPGKALHFNSYYKFRRHLVEVHNEKPVSNICEYCGLRSLKRNYLLHHLYAQHGVQPPPQYHFPKCNLCSYIALTEGLLVKHKLSHKDIKNFRCNVCSAAFASSSQLLQHIQNTGHKYSAEKKPNLQCIYCLKVFLRETNLYAHIKTHHKIEAKSDGIIEDSDEEEKPRTKPVKFEPSTSYDNEFELEIDLQYPSPQQRSAAEKQVTPRKQVNIANQKQKILNAGFGTPKPAQKPKPINSMSPSVHNDFFQDIKIPISPLSNNNQEDEIVVIENNEYIMRDNQLIPKNRKTCNTDFILSSLEAIQPPTTTVDYGNIQNTDVTENVPQQSSMIIKKTTNLNQPIQIVVSNEDEYKALMASNHPIIFDNGESNKTLTVLTAPHHNQDVETRTIDLDTTQSNDMMILPEGYHSSLNVSEAVTSDNSNIVVVYSHPVDDQNKQFQIITTGGAQFVQSSAIITQNFETVTTSTPTMNAHCIETQVDQNWQNNMQSLDGQEIQLHSHAVIQGVDSNQVVIKPILTETGDNLDELPEVHLGHEIQKELPPSETDIALDQSNITIEHINETVEHNVAEEQTNVTELNLIENETSNIPDNETLETVPHTKSMPEINTNDENIQEQMEIENVLQQPGEIENVMEQPMETDNIEQQIETETVVEHPIETSNSVEQPMLTEGVLEEPIRADNELERPLDADSAIEQQIMTTNMAEEPVQTENMMVLPMETENVLHEQISTENTVVQSIEYENIEKPVELDNFIEAPVETVPVENEGAAEQTSNQTEVSSNHEQLAETMSEYTVIENPEIPSASEDQQAELIASQAYDDIVEINRDINVEPKETELVQSQTYDEIAEITNTNNGEPMNIHRAKGKIQSLTSEWSEDEFEVAEDQSSRITAIASNSLPQPQPNEDVPELEESIENIQQEVQKQIQMPPAPSNNLVQPVHLGQPEPDVQVEPDCETEESAVSSQEEDSSSQEMILPPLVESPILENPQAQQKISSLLNDWEDNDSQEEINTVSENTDLKSTEDQPLPDSSEDPKNDNIKSLVSDWDDDEEEIKE
ncbi:centrosome-associated zinc finger protein CP190 [Helicoverpa zea]|uniref:centrosome-associated zinc finger protein CP190 n=1 Tax=Helicoverpa zea TaxID=7113 RepID=UPI001F584A65|nr:centrosome-associated zinc finger protein CP190 [Helicoverpa zea]